MQIQYCIYNTKKSASCSLIIGPHNERSDSAAVSAYGSPVSRPSTSSRSLSGKILLTLYNTHTQNEYIYICSFISDMLCLFVSWVMVVLFDYIIFLLYYIIFHLFFLSYHLIYLYLFILLFNYFSLFVHSKCFFPAWCQPVCLC